MYTPFYEHVTFHTSLAPREIGRRLSTLIEAKKQERAPSTDRIEPWVFEGTGAPLYEGSQAFAITTAVKDRNAYAPLIAGRLKWDASGTLVDLTLRLQPLQIVAMTLWTMGAVAALMRPGFYLRAIGGICLCWEIVALCFQRGCREAKRSLCELLECTEGPR